MLLQGGHRQLTNSEALLRAQRSRLACGLTDQQQQGPHPSGSIGHVADAD